MAARVQPMSVISPLLTGPVLVIVAVVLGCSLYANLSWLVTRPATYRFFPPFERNVNHNDNGHLGAEYYNIAGALFKGRGFADPFQTATGPTAWMPPLLSWLLAALRWAADDDKDIVVALYILLQDLTLIGAGWLVVALAQYTTGGVWLATLVYVVSLLLNFRLCFQFTHDCWIILAALSLLVAGLVWTRPFASTWKWAAAWGVFGGLCALTSPVTGFTWAVLALATGLRGGGRGRLAVAVSLAVLTITPWVIRNYLIFGRLIPVKSNLAFELYQSHVLRSDGILGGGIFGSHPYVSNNKERRRYAELGEMAYLDEKMQLFRTAIEADPAGFFRRVGNRFLAATVLYTPFDRTVVRRHPWVFRVSRWMYPLPFACLILVSLAGAWRGAYAIRPALTAEPAALARATNRAGESIAVTHWIVIGTHLAYLLPYVVVSFYDRYKLPLLSVDALLIVWGIDCVKRFFLWLRSEDEPVEVLVEVDDESTPVRQAVVAPSAGRSTPKPRSRPRIHQQTDGDEP